MLQFLPPEKENISLREPSLESEAFKAFIKEAFPEEVRQGAKMTASILVGGLALYAGIIGLAKTTFDQEGFECFVDLMARGNSVYSTEGNDPCANPDIVTTEDGTMYTTAPEVVQ